ncbi:hypothetical protein PF010_g12740 [Phytophthora fragariae]|uniref:Uncharacterized protein n=1 Tax=Phytophthora fragariae TaxID=53985 RepID=A0A6G0L2Q0_9STRA|nr:hypothetical protein PF010_g12740 [Phytophthora fragariae]
MDVRDAIHQDVFSKVYDFREFVDATSGAADVRRRGEGGTREQDVGRAREAGGRGLGEDVEGGTREQDVGRAREAGGRGLGGRRTVKEGPVSKTSGEPEKQEGVDLEDGKRTVKEGPVSRTSGEPEKQEGVDLEDGGR